MNTRHSRILLKYLQSNRSSDAGEGQGNGLRAGLPNSETPGSLD